MAGQQSLKSMQVFINDLYLFQALQCYFVGLFAFEYLVAIVAGDKTTRLNGPSEKLY